MKTNIYKIYEDNGRVVEIELPDCMVADYCFEKYGWGVVWIHDSYKPKRVQNGLKARRW